MRIRLDLTVSGCAWAADWNPLLNSNRMRPHFPMRHDDNRSRRHAWIRVPTHSA
jgi:hypothetical protein